MKQIATIVAVVASVLVACVPPQQSYGASPPSTYHQQVGTGIFVNGIELTANDVAQLEAIVGERVPAGRYAMDDAFDFGYEGQPAAVNLRTLAEAKFGTHDTRSSRPFSTSSRNIDGSVSSIVDDGNGCTIMSTPSGSFSSGC